MPSATAIALAGPVVMGRESYSRMYPPPPNSCTSTALAQSHPVKLSFSVHLVVLAQGEVGAG